MTEVLQTPDQVIQIIADSDQVLAILDPGAVLVTFEPDTIQNVIMAFDVAPVMQTLVSPEIQQIAIITEGPQGAPGPPGSGTADPESGSIVKDLNGAIIQVVLESKTIDITREGGQIASFTDGTHTWTITRGLDGSIASWEVT